MLLLIFKLMLYEKDTIDYYCDAGMGADSLYGSLPSRSEYPDSVVV